MSQTDDGWIEEATLAVLLGVDRGVLKKIRPHLPAGAVKEKTGGAVVWEKSAAVNEAMKLGLAFQWPGEPVPEKSAATVERVTVVRTPPNRHIVTCRRPSGEEIHVRVVDNRKYVPVGLDGKPMTLEATKNSMGNWWNLVGREPRWRGRF